MYEYTDDLCYNLIINTMSSMFSKNKWNPNDKMRPLVLYKQNLRVYPNKQNPLICCEYDTINDDIGCKWYCNYDDPSPMQDRWLNYSTASTTTSSSTMSDFSSCDILYYSNVFFFHPSNSNLPNF